MYLGQYSGTLYLTASKSVPESPIVKLKIIKTYVLIQSIK